MGILGVGYSGGLIEDGWMAKIENTVDPDI